MYLTKRYGILMINFFVVANCCFCCTICKQMLGFFESPAEVYKIFLNLDPPAEISDLHAEGRLMFPDFLSQAYFTYKAEHTYFNILQNHDKFFRTAEQHKLDASYNERIHVVSCNSLPQDFSYWTKDNVDLTDKQCYTGTFFPYIHYLVYDPKTGQVQHFVEGMRD